MRYLPETTLEVNEPSVISETIDGETIIINLASGTYYSLKDAGLSFGQQSSNQPA